MNNRVELAVPAGRLVVITTPIAMKRTVITARIAVAMNLASKTGASPSAIFISHATRVLEPAPSRAAKNTISICSICFT